MELSLSQQCDPSQTRYLWPHQSDALAIKEIMVETPFFKIIFLLQLALTIMTAITFLRFTTTSGLPTTAEDLGLALESDDNQAGRQKSQSLRTWWCKHYNQAQLQVMLQQLGDGPGGISLGGFNPQYMAFTWQEAQKLPVLVTNASVPQSRVFTIAQPSSLMSYSNCRMTVDGCIECNARRDLGPNKVPRFINEVTCQQVGACKFGACKSAALNQRFFHKTGKCDPSTGYEEILEYTQPIQVCCKCMLFSI